MTAVLVASLALLAESFGREVWGLWQQRHLAPDRVALPGPQPEPGRERAHGNRSRVRTAVAGLVSVLAFLLVWVALVAPNEMSQLTPSAFLRIPLEGLLVVALVLALPATAGRTMAVVVGLVLGLLTIVKVLDTAFYETLGRSFNPVTDGNYFEPAVSFLKDQIGQGTAIAAMVGVVVLGVVVLVVVPLSMLRLTRVADRHRPVAIRAVTALGVVWILCAVTGAQIVPGAPIASTSAAALTYRHVRRDPGHHPGPAGVRAGPCR